VNVTVTTPGGTSAAGTAAKFGYLARPAVTNVAPATGSVAGGTTVTVTGTGFTGASAVMFGTAPAASFTVVSATQITAGSPAHAKGTVSVTVTAPGGTSAAGTATKFAYITTAANRRGQRNRAGLRNGPLTASTVLASYGYNGDGLRMSKTTSAGTQQFTWDTSQQVPQVLADGSNDYIYGPGGLPIEQLSTAGTASYFFHDNNGNTRALLNGSGGIGATFSYTPYGALASRTGTLATPLLYGQGYTDPATSLIYLINRYYDPATGQFMSVDPLDDQTDQPYQYAGDNPLNQSDPAGLFCVLGHNPNGSCRGSNVSNDLHVVTTGVAVVGVVAGAVGVAIAGAPELAAASAVLIGVATVATGIVATVGIGQEIYTCLAHGIGSSACSGGILRNDLTTLMSFIPGKTGEIIGVLSLLNLGPVELAPGTTSSGGSSRASSGSGSKASSAAASANLPC
jgi:RHS repeat-associated protein